MIRHLAWLIIGLCGLWICFIGLPNWIAVLGAVLNVVTIILRIIMIREEMQCS